MNKAIILYGPSGVGKTSLARKIASKLKFKHCDTDEFMLIFSPKRSRERSEIAYKVCYEYAKELINRKYDIIIESISKKYFSKIKVFLKKKNYKIVEITLTCSLERCLRNNKKRTARRFSDRAIKEAYVKHSSKRGIVIDVEKLSSDNLFKLLKNKFT